MWVMRAWRFLDICRLSGNPRLAFAAVRGHCQAVIQAFLIAGGSIDGATVRYGGVTISRLPFTKANLGGVGYVKRLVDLGAAFEPNSSGFTTLLPNGLRFAAQTDKFVDTLAMLVERFADEEYAWLDVAGRLVIDIGANVGDSVLYFALRGARFVYGYESDNTFHTAALRNVALNNLTNLDIRLAHITGTRDMLAMTASLSFAETTQTARADYPGVPIVCKIDCEGCEYDIFARETLLPADVEDIEQFMIEYHDRSPSPIVECLHKLGFRTSEEAGAPGVGWIRARS